MNKSYQGVRGKYFLTMPMSELTSDGQPDLVPSETKRTRRTSRFPTGSREEHLSVLIYLSTDGSLHRNEGKPPRRAKPLEDKAGRRT